MAPAEIKGTACNASNGGPEKPRGQHDTQRHLVAIEDDDQFPHQYDLPDDCAEPHER
jgi:hypothetical protein